MKTFKVTINRVQSESYEIEADSIYEAVRLAYDRASNEDWAGKEAEYRLLG